VREIAIRYIDIVAGLAITRSGIVADGRNLLK
jgi:hypothetical protein